MPSDVQESTMSSPSSTIRGPGRDKNVGAPLIGHEEFGQVPIGYTYKHMYWIKTFSFNSSSKACFC